MLPAYLKGFEMNKASAQSGLLARLDSPLSRNLLKKDDIICLKSFFNELGGADVDAQTALCALYEALLEERLRAARLHAEKYAQIYTVLGALAGMAVIILFI